MSEARPLARCGPQGPLTLGAVLRSAVLRLREANLDEPETDAALLLAHLLGLSRSELRLRLTDVAARSVAEAYEQLLQRRLSREPLAYILGTQEFMGLVLHVDRRVFIPRPETEVLVEAVCDRLRDVQRPVIADIGCGSGAIAIALAHTLVDATVHGVDIAADALQVARLNVAQHGLHARVQLHQGDLFEPLRHLGLEGRLAAIVSNPPYVADDQFASLQPEISCFEPALALLAGPDGMMFHRRLIRGGGELLAPGGLLALEVGLGQAKSVADQMVRAGYSNTEVLRDLSGIDRVVVGWWSA